LHRDVSAGNILICPHSTDVQKTSGCLIDLDYAKKTADFIDPEPFISVDNQNEDLRDICMGLHLMVKPYHKPGVDNTGVSALLSLIGPGRALSYVQYILRSKPFLKAITQPVSFFTLRITVL
jgi:hypothetical protein